MDEKQLQALANELAKNLKTPEDLSQFDRLLKKLSVEAALNAEMTHHLGYEKNQTRITGMDNQILLLYAKGMTTREIATAFKELYDADVSPARKRTARAVLTGMCYSAGSAMRHGSSSRTRLTGQSAMTPSTWRR